MCFANRAQLSSLKGQGMPGGGTAGIGGSLWWCLWCLCLCFAGVGEDAGCGIAAGLALEAGCPAGFARGVCCGSGAAVA